jgi:hypothetical protein
MRRQDVQDATGRSEYNAGYGQMRAWGSAAPTNNQQGFAPGCIYQQLAGSYPFLWLNVGTFAASKWASVSDLAYANTAASTAVTATASETLFDTFFTIPANSLRAGSVIQIHYQGIATLTNGTDTLQTKLYLGGLTGTALQTGTATDVANNNIFAGDAFLVIRTIGASGTFVASGSFTAVPAASGTATRVEVITGSTALDTTAAIVIGVSATWSTNNAGNSCRLDELIVSIY